MSTPFLVPASKLVRASEGLRALVRAAQAAEDEFAADLAAVAPDFRESARNLVHYVAVRRHDLRSLQDDLARLGLSSLGRMEAHVLASLNAVLRVLEALQGEAPFSAQGRSVISFAQGDKLLKGHTAAILGPAERRRHTRIMVTMPGSAADDPALMRDLVRAGMRVMRINCAHDDAGVWARMIEHLRRAEQATGKRCLVSFDLAGPKLRTGPIAPGPAVMKWRPERDALGRVTVPARVRLVPATPGHQVATGTLPVSAHLFAKIAVGDTLDVVDARGRKRRLNVLEAAPAAWMCDSDATAYIVPGTRLTLRRGGAAIETGEVGELPLREGFVELRAGDVMNLVFGNLPGRGAMYGEHGKVTEPARVACALPELFSAVRPGEPILFDDGKIRGVVRDVHRDRLKIAIASVGGGGTVNLRGEKGINVPKSDLGLSALTAKDLVDLDFIVEHGGMVALSFVRTPEDVEMLIAALHARRASHLGIVLKIETRAAFDRLPSLLLAAMRHPPVAVMVARGDLGVELGFERLSEVQEEILWFCEAAHVPVIWATQVLESLTKGGMPSRAEVTDAAMGSRAECVMLNKGPYIRETLRFLADVLTRMQAHQHKKSARLRKLRISEATPRRAGAAEARARQQRTPA